MSPDDERTYRWEPPAWTITDPKEHIVKKVVGTNGDDNTLVTQKELERAVVVIANPLKKLANQVGELKDQLDALRLPRSRPPLPE